jgi:hypothetical protein
MFTLSPSLCIFWLSTFPDVPGRFSRGVASTDNILPVTQHTSTKCHFILCNEQMVTLKKDKIMISEISPATPITDFTTIDILNVFQTKLTMRIGSKYMSYCFFVVFLSPSW